MKNSTQPITTFGVLAIFFLLIFSITIVDAQQHQMEMTGQEMKESSSMTPQKPEDISPLLNGEKIPAVTLLDAAGKSFNLNQSIAKKPTILIFYRGGWCPYCSKQLSGLQSIAPDLEKTGYQIIAISTDQPEGLVQSASKEKLHYTLLSDSDLNAAKQFGIAFKAPKNYWDMLPKTTGGKNTELLLPVPSVFIVDKKGIIHFEYINPDFKQRLNPELLKSVAQSIISDL